MATYFTFNGIGSKEYSLKCKEISHLSFAAKSYESIKIPGRTGNLIIDDGSYENKIIPVIAYLDMRSIPIEKPIVGWDTTDPENLTPIYGENKKDRINNIHRWLLGEVGYKELVFDDKFTYNAIVNGEVTFIELFADYFEITINFECAEVIN